MSYFIKILVTSVLLINQISLLSQSKTTDGNLENKDSMKAISEDIEQFADGIYNEYASYKESSLFKRRHKYTDILPLIEKHDKKSLFEVSRIGKSFEGRDIFRIKIGEGKTNILIWSQMHGDEATATQALFDIMNFFASDKEFEKERALLLNKLCLFIIPMLNPDGSQNFERRNAQNIDLNRDALRLSSPEAKILKEIRDETNAAYGFNLHDQNIYSTAGLTAKPATISFLAPAFNVQKDMNDNRRNAMTQIVVMNEVLQKYIPGQVGRYNDDFMPTSLGDNIQKWGTGAILIESGGYKNDPEKQYIRKLNFISILSALYSIALETDNIDYKAYFSIPENEDEKLYDLIIRNAKIKTKEINYVIDIGIRREEKDNKKHSDFKYYSTIENIGDLSYLYGYEEIDADGLIAQKGKFYPKKIKSGKQLNKLNVDKLLSEGYIYLHVSRGILEKELEKKPFILTSKAESEKESLKIDKQANFLLLDSNVIKYVIINGFVVN